MLQIGDAVPDFKLESDSAGTVSAKALRGQRYVIFFYPKDNTPGCTKEVCSFRDHMAQFEQLGVPVFGASADDAKAHGKFASKYQLNFPLLIDPDQSLLQAFGVWVEKSMYGRTYFGVQRATYVNDANGIIEHVWPKVKPEGHAAQVWEYLQG